MNRDPAITIGAGARKAKRALEEFYLMIGENGGISFSQNRLDAAVFTVGGDEKLTADGLVAFATPAEVIAGGTDFKIGAEDIANFETAFTFPAGLLSWDNPSFTNAGHAIFGFPDSGVGNIIVSFDGTLPPGYSEVTFDVITTSDPAFSFIGGFSATVPSPSTSFSASGPAVVNTEGVTGAESVTAGPPLSTRGVQSFGTAVTGIVPLSSGPAMTTSTAQTTITHTITACPPAVTDCPIGQVVTETIDVYTTVYPVGSGGSTQPTLVIGILVSIIIDITVEINININGATETVFYTQTLTSDSRGLYNQAIEDQRKKTPNFNKA